MLDSVQIVLLTISVLVVVANAAVCVLVVVRKRLRTYTNGFVLSLAISDILTGGVFMPFNLLNPMHIAHGFVTMLVIVSSTCNLSAVAFDRYLAVVKPLAYKTKIAGSFARLVCAVWGVAVMMTVLPITWKADQSLLVHKIYVSCAVALFLVFPLVFILFVYSYIFVRLRRHGRLLRAMQGTRTRFDEVRKSRQEKKTVKMFSSIVALFLVSWFPVIVMTMAFVANKPVPAYVFTISNFSITISSLANPFMYTLMKLDFREEVIALLGKRKTLKRKHVPFEHNRLYSISPSSRTQVVEENKKETYC
ncbi:neuropeptides capa receptor [Nematostella vectensis]|uniref:neuropeptides capa receptor n=1 Tax=Nematostella vectensis TaxID=45351 RepID=UPI00207755DC|nr:neuropeptides capa receptor [Nematostella vectensis]